MDWMSVLKTFLVLLLILGFIAIFGGLIGGCFSDSKNHRRTGFFVVGMGTAAVVICGSLLSGLNT